MASSKPDQLKVLQLCHDYEGPFQKICHQYNKALPDGEVTTVYLRGKPDDNVTRVTGGDRVIYLELSEGSLRGIKFSPIFQLAKLFRAYKFNLVIAHRYKAIYLAGIMSYFFAHLMIFGVAHEHNVFKRITRSLFVTFWRRNIEIIAVSASVARDIVRSCPALGKQNRVHILGHALSPESELLTRELARQRLGGIGDRFVFGTVGRLVEKKQFDRLLAAFAEADLGERCLLVVVGTGPKAQALHDQAANLGLANRVMFTGKIDQAMTHFRAFDCFVFPAGDEEAFGVVLLEAMFTGLPIVASSAPGPDDVLGDIGLRYQDQKDFVQKLRDVYQLNDVQRQALGVAAKVRFEENFTIEHFVTKFHALLAETDRSSVID